MTKTERRQAIKEAHLEIFNRLSLSCISDKMPGTYFISDSGRRNSMRVISFNEDNVGFTFYFLKTCIKVWCGVYYPWACIDGPKYLIRSYYKYSDMMVFSNSISDDADFIRQLDDYISFTVKLFKTYVKTAAYVDAAKDYEVFGFMLEDLFEYKYSYTDDYEDLQKLYDTIESKLFKRMIGRNE